MLFNRVKSIAIPEGMVKQISIDGVVVWQASSGVTYTPILPSNTTTYPMCLKGWKSYKVTSVSATGSNSTVNLDTGIDGANPSTCFCTDYDGIINTTSLSNTPNKSVKYGFTTASMRDRIYIKDTDIGTTVAEWNSYLANHPIGVLFELATSDNSLWFAVTDGTNYGYYNPSTEEFFKPYGMTGTIIQRCQYVSMDGTQYVNTGINLTGADTVTIDMVNKKSGDNIFGSWHSNNTDVYTLYASTSSSYVRYNSSLYRNTPIPLNTRLVFRMTPTGDYVGATRYHTWTEGDFDTATPCLVGWLNGSGSPHMKGDIYDFEILNKCHLIPVKVGTAYYLMDILNWVMPTHNGTLSGGAVIDEPIPFPEAPVTLMMGGNPFYPSEPNREEEPEDE